VTSLSTLALAYCAVVLVASYALRGSTGFGGFAAMPLMALAVPMKLLVPVWSLLVIASSVTLIGRDRTQVSLRDIVHVVPSCLVGVAAGLYLFTTLDARLLARGFGLLVSGYALYTLWNLRRTARAPSRGSPAVAHTAGVLAGAMGTVFGTMSSIFFAIYLDARSITKAQFRATISALMLLLALVRGAGYLAVGVFEREALILFALAFPFMLVGMYLGDRVHARIDETTFKRLVCGILLVSGGALMLR
jgi:Predicted permeases